MSLNKKRTSLPWDINYWLGKDCAKRKLLIKKLNGPVKSAECKKLLNLERVLVKLKQRKLFSPMTLHRQLVRRQPF